MKSVNHSTDNITRRSSTANRRSVCLRQKIAFLGNVVCYLDLWTHDLENGVSVLSTWCRVIAIFIKNVYAFRRYM